jgi:hypothetical protein
MKPSPLDHLPRRSLFAEATVTPAVKTIIRSQPSFPVHKPEPVPVTLDSPKPVKLAAAVAALVEIGAPPVEPAPLVDTTQRGRGRPKLSEADAIAAKEAERKRRREWTAARRARAKVDQVALASR